MFSCRKIQTPSAKIFVGPQPFLGGYPTGSDTFDQFSLQSNFEGQFQITGSDWFTKLSIAYYGNHRAFDSFSSYPTQSNIVEFLPTIWEDVGGITSYGHGVPILVDINSVSTMSYVA